MDYLVAELEARTPNRDTPCVRFRGLAKEQPDPDTHLVDSARWLAFLANLAGPEAIPPWARFPRR
jgi:hypothetical protein